MKKLLKVIVVNSIRIESIYHKKNLILLSTDTAGKIYNGFLARMLVIS